MDRKSDELILQGLRQGDCKAFDELYMRYAPRVEAFACCMLKSRSEAEDLAHDIFLKIWENRRSIGHIRSLGNYLFRMTKNAVFDRFEHKSVQVRYERQCLAAGDFLSDDVAAKIASEDLLMIVELAVERMPEQRQRVFRLSRYERLSHQEIARELGLLDRVKAVGWAGLSAKETGRIGGLMGRENRAAPPAVPVPFAVPKPLTVPEPPDSQATKEGE